MTDVIAKSPATIDDLRCVPKDGQVYELVDGAIIVTPAGMRHSDIAARITVVLGNFVLSPGVRVHRAGEPVTEHAGDEVLTAELVLPGFSCQVSQFFPR